MIIPRSFLLKRAFHALNLLCCVCIYFSICSHSTILKGDTDPLLLRISFRILKIIFLLTFWPTSLLYDNAEERSLTKALHVLKMLCFRCFYFSSRSHSTTRRGTTTGPLLYRISFRIWKSSSGHIVCLAWLLSWSCSIANQWIKWCPRTWDTYWPALL